MLSGVFLFVVMQPSMIARHPYAVPEASYNNWEEILSHPQPITIRTYAAGVNRTKLSGIMNLEHERAQGIEDTLIDIPINVGVVEHEQHGVYLIDAGLDASYEHNPYGTNKGMMVEKFLAKGSLGTQYTYSRGSGKRKHSTARRMANPLAYGPYSRDRRSAQGHSLCCGTE